MITILWLVLGDWERLGQHDIIYAQSVLEQSPLRGLVKLIGGEGFWHSTRLTIQLSLWSLIVVALGIIAFVYLKQGTLPSPGEATDQSASSYKWDVFISHACEDKDDFVRPLADRLTSKGLRVWYDEMALSLGDSLLVSINSGLRHSRFGVVVISPNFIKKQWPQRELDGLTAREVDGRKVILPIWHQIGADDVRQFLPTLAGRLAVQSDLGMERVVEDIVKAVRLRKEL